MKHLIVVSFILISIFTFFSQAYCEQSSSGQEISKLLYDNFADNSNQWKLGEDDQHLLKIENGKLIFRNKTTNSIYFVYNSTDMDGDEPFSIQSTISHKAGVKDLGFGIIWGVENANNYYFFNISDTGGYIIGRIKDGEWHTYVNWTYSTHVNQNGLRNSLWLEKEDDKIKFYINANYLAEINYEDIFANGVGFNIGGDQTIEISNINVKGIKE